MGSTRGETYRALQALYDQVPAIPDCQGHCWISCGPIEMSDAERTRIRRAGHKISDAAEVMRTSVETFWCEALTSEGRCAVYDMRPMVCFLPSTWIYTADGPKRIAEIVAGERVYGADGRPHRVLATSSRLYDGLITNVRHTGTHVPCWSTADHRWLTTRQRDKRKRPAPEWREASALIVKRQHQEGDYLCYPRQFEDRAPLEQLDVRAYIEGRAEGDMLVPFTGGRAAVRNVVRAIPLYIPVTDEFLHMLGIYLAEGHATSAGAGFTMHPDEAPVLERIAKYLDSLEITCHTLRVGRSAVLSVHSALLARLLRTLGGVSGYGRPESKAMHPGLFGQLSHGQLWEVYTAWDKGDGRKCLREQEMSTATSSERLAVQMGFIALANGLFPRTYGAKRPNRGRTAWDVHLYPSNWRDAKQAHGTKNMADDQYIYTPVAGSGQYRRGPADPEHYSGPVLDLQVEDAESFVTSSGIAHNCRIWGVAESMPCPYGCRPERWLSDEEAYRLIVASIAAGGGAGDIWYDPDEVDGIVANRQALQMYLKAQERGRNGIALRMADYSRHMPPEITRRPRHKVKASNGSEPGHG